MRRPGKLYGMNASGWAPAGISIQFLKSKGITEMPTLGIQSVTVPGVVDGWSKMLSRFGTKKLPEVLAPAIYYARTRLSGARMGRRLLERSRHRNQAQAGQERRRDIFDRWASSPSGQIFRNPDLAHSLELVASGGRDAFYKGELAKAIVARSTELGGTMTLEDFADYSSEWVEPISTTYHGWTVYELPPNGQGIAALEMLNMMEKFPLAKFGQNSADALHVMIEAKKLAYADLASLCGRSEVQPDSGRWDALEAIRSQRAEFIDMAQSQLQCRAGRARQFRRTAIRRI